MKDRKKAAHIAVVSLNEGVDIKCFLMKPLEVGGMNRIERIETAPGSKGANNARMLHYLGADVTYIAVTGGARESECKAFTEGIGIPSRFVPTAAGVRENFKFHDASGVATECNQKGGPVTPPECEAFRAAVLAVRADAYLLSGSLPAGVAVTFYRDLIQDIRKKYPDSRVVLDTSGAALLSALEGAPPDLIKPNRAELLELLGETEETAPCTELATDLQRCRRFRARFGSTALLCSLGGDGAILADERGITVATVRTVEKPENTVGAGDTFLSAYLAKFLSSGDADAALRSAAATATVYVKYSQGIFPPREEIAREESAVSLQKETV